MRYENLFLDKLVGGAVVVKQLTAPDVDEELADSLAENPLSTATQLLQSRTALFVLAGYDGLGVSLRMADGSPGMLFVPWSAIIELSAAEEGDTGGS